MAQTRFAEPLDEAFLQALDLAEHRGRLGEFWPKSGPRWDALAVLETAAGDLGYLLVEAKSYPEEVTGPGCTAKAPRSVKLIDRSLAATKEWLDVAPEVDWKGPYYQYANRLAHVFFLRQILGLEAWLVNLCFTGDPLRPTTQEEWHVALRTAKGAVGLGEDGAVFVLDVILPARERDLLLTATPEAKGAPGEVNVG